MRCRFLVFVVCVAGLLGCDAFLKNPVVVESHKWILDDGLLELTPDYNVRHVEGEPYSEVTVGFRANALKKVVRLRPGDSISVNGQSLPYLEDSKHFYYQAKIATTEGQFTFTLTRASRPIVSHTFALPALDILELPKAYRPLETIDVPVGYVIPPQYVTERYDMDIHVLGNGISMISTVRSPQNRYEIDRLPDIKNGFLHLRYLTGGVVIPGRYPATFIHHHNIVLSEMSDASNSGWINLFNIRNFTIEIK